LIMPERCGGARFWFMRAARCAAMSGALKAVGRERGAKRFAKYAIYFLSLGFKYMARGPRT
jgi:hypothetical protein